MPIETIVLRPTVGSNNQILWELCNENNCGGPGSSTNDDYPVVEVLGRDTLVIFQIEENSDNPHGIRFANASSAQTNASDAIWVRPGQGNKPPEKGMNSNGQFVNASLPNPQTLVFSDKNDRPAPQWFTYQLNFVDERGQPVDPIDPEIKNGGSGMTEPTDGTGFGGTGVSQSLWNAETIIVALVAAVILLIIGGLIGRATK